MLDVNDISEPIIAWHQVPNVDAPFTLHYDETNNIRRLLLTPDGLNIRIPQCFVLGGVAHRDAPPPLDFEHLRTIFGLQKTSRELKLEQLGKGDFIALLNAPRVGALLEWLAAQDLFIHYQVLDPLYWSIVDVIDSIITEDGNVQLLMFAPMLKNDLYALLRDDVAATAEMLGRYNYPDVGRHQRVAFIAELRDLLETRRDRFAGFNYQMLKGVLDLASNLPTLPYLEDENPNVLIDGFGAFYLHRLALFKNATHVLDIEPTIEAYLLGFDLRDGDAPVGNYTFVDSKARAWVQVSDAVAGLLGKLFTFINRTPIAEIERVLNGLSVRPQKSLTALIGIINRSVEECPALVHYVVSLEDHQRRSAFLGS